MSTKELSDFEAVQQVSINNLRRVRELRLRRLTGKYVVSAVSNRTKGLVFYQDPSLSRIGGWSTFLANSLAFSSEGDAIMFKSSLLTTKHINFRVAIVNSRGEHQFL